VIATAAAAARARAARAPGVLVAAAGVSLFFLALRLRGWYWPDFGVPGGTGLYFLDLRFFTSAWECVREGVDVIPANPCDPRSRAWNYPRLWLVPAPLGLGQEHTVRLGYVLVAGFYASAFAAMGRARLVDGVVWAAALCSPAVMLGVERGSTDMLIFSLVVCSALLLNSARMAARVAAHGLFLLVALLKLYPVLAWAPLLRRPGRRALVGIGILTAAFAVDILVTWADVRRVRELLPRDDSFAYGASILGKEAGGRLVVVAASLALALLLTWLARRRGVAIGPSRTREESRDLDLFLAGAAVFVGTFTVERNFDYRLMFLLLTLPMLLRRSRERSVASPFAALGVAAVVGTLWLSSSLPVVPLGFGEWWVQRLSSFPYDELINAALSGYLAAALLLALRRDGARA
jgi:hypothetical protein